MSFFESLLALLLAAILCLQVSRRIGLPYPAMLAAAGVVVALLPGAPSIALEPHTALALFVAPALVDAAFDFPIGAALRLWVPLVALAVVAVLVTAGLVGWIGWWAQGLPLAAGIALGAIVAPPDAVAATAVLGSVSVPRSTEGVLRGESLFNDATALLLFNMAVTVQAAGGLTPGVSAMLALSAPGGILFGIAAGWLSQKLSDFVDGTLGGNLFQFAYAFLLWLVAERLHLSAVLALVAFAMTIARSAGITHPPRMRVHSYAVWSTVVFLLNVLAFLLMGMQARVIVGGMSHDRLMEAARFAGLIVATVIAARMVLILAFNRWMAWRARARGETPPARLTQAVLVGWAGMRGILTLATAFALPKGFPERDLLVLTAFAVVLTTLVLQGATLGPLIRLLGLDRREAQSRHLAQARGTLAAAALHTLGKGGGPEADALRHLFRVQHDAAAHDRHKPVERLCRLGLSAVKAQRQSLEELRAAHKLDTEGYLLLQEELDWRELTLLPEDDRRIEEN